MLSRVLFPFNICLVHTQVHTNSTFQYKFGRSGSFADKVTGNGKHSITSHQLTPINPLWAEALLTKREQLISCKVTSTGVQAVTLLTGGFDISSTSTASNQKLVVSFSSCTSQTCTSHYKGCVLSHNTKMSMLLLHSCQSHKILISV